MGVDHLFGHLTGTVTPLYTQTYTFYTVSDDGSRLWINNQLIVGSWFDQPATERSGTIALTAGQPYNLKMEYYENGGGAVARLLWSSASQAKEVIPASRLRRPRGRRGRRFRGRRDGRSRAAGRSRSPISPRSLGPPRGAGASATGNGLPAESDPHLHRGRNLYRGFDGDGTGGPVSTQKVGYITVNSSVTGLQATYYDNMDFTGTT